MPTLYVTEPGAVVRASGKSLVVTRTIDPDGRSGPEPEHRDVLVEVEPHRLELIVLVGHTHITSEAVYVCLKNKIDVAWLASEGRAMGRLVATENRSGAIRLAQYAAMLDEARRLTYARNVVSAKIRNAAEVLEGIQSNYADLEAIPEAIAGLRQLEGRAGSEERVERLLGIEGTAAHTYFTALGTAFRGEIMFHGRKRRPPPDPANALLSFGYVLLCNMIAAGLDARGLDSSLGFFHTIRAGRPSLALDLLEELRHPVVDRFVLRACNLRTFRQEHFQPGKDGKPGVRLTRAGLKVFFREWEKMLVRPLRDAVDGQKWTPRQVIHRQIDRLAGDLRDGRPYLPFICGD